MERGAGREGSTVSPGLQGAWGAPTTWGAGKTQPGGAAGGLRGDAPSAGCDETLATRGIAHPRGTSTGACEPRAHPPSREGPMGQLAPAERADLETIIVNK